MIKEGKLTWVLLMILALGACQTDALKTDKSGLQYKILRVSSDTARAKLGDVLVIRYRILDERKELVEETALFRIKLRGPSHTGGAVENGLALMHKGDSAMFLILAKSYFEDTREMDVPEGVSPDSKLQFHVKLVDIISDEEIKEEQEALIISGERSEELMLKKFIEQNKIKTEPEGSGLYLIPIKIGKGSYPSPGNKVVVHYEGSFIDGTVFDSSFERNKPFEFTVGIGQVIYGWDEGVSKMKLGSEYRLIIPSYLAYGSKQNGPIPPFSTLVFDVVLLSVNE